MDLCALERPSVNTSPDESWVALTDRGTALLKQSLSENNIETLHEAVECLKTAATASSGEGGNALYSFKNLSDALLARFQEVGNPADLDDSLVNVRKSLELTPAGHPNHSATYINVGDILIIRFQYAGRRSDLDEAIANYQSALQLLPIGHPDLSSSFNNLANVLVGRFEQFGDCSDLDGAITYHQNALELRPPGHPLHFSTINNLAGVLSIRFRQIGDRVDLDKAIGYYRSSLELTTPDNPFHSAVLNNLASTLFTRFVHFGDRAYLDEAIIQHQNALKLRPPGHPDRSASLNDLANALFTRFEQNGDRIDLGDAIIHHEKALELTQHDHPDRPMTLNNLASTLFTRFEEVGDRADLDKAIIYCLDALELAPPEHSVRSSILENLASLLFTRFEEVGERVDLDGAIIHYRSALEMTPVGHPDRSGVLNNLANTLLIRFEQIGDRLDLDDAITCCRNALEVISPGHPGRSSILDNLANALSTRFKRFEDLADLDEAVVHHQTALELTLPGQPLRSGILNNLAGTLLARFRSTGDRACLDDAISYHRTTLELCPPGHPGRAGILRNLANDLSARFKEAGDCADLDEAIGLYQAALDLAPPGHPHHANRGTALACALLLELNRHTSNVDPGRRRVLALLRGATLVTAGGPLSERLKASLIWIDLAGEWSDASGIDAYRVSLELLETFLSTGPSLESRHQRLKSMDSRLTRSIAINGAACAIASGQVELAVELLEQGRSVLLAQAGRYRTRVDDIEVVDFTIAAEFRHICERMESSIFARERPDMNRNRTLAKDDSVASYQQLLDEWANIIVKIRSLSGFSTFLQPTPFSIIRQAALYGPVIILNVATRRTDAVIVTLENNPYLLHLPDATQNFVANLSKGTTDASIRTFLRIIWQTIVRPIVKVLQDEFRLQAGSRIWWCPTGAASHLPLHAAGDYTERDQNLPDLFVSSYTSTLSALLRARQMPSIIVRKMLIVGRPDDLPSVGNEIQIIKESLINACENDDSLGRSDCFGRGIATCQALVPSRPSRSFLSLCRGFPSSISSCRHPTIFVGPEGTRDAVLGALVDHSWVHFACHGHVNESQPFKSNFSLYGGPLNLLDIARQTLPHADLAFLAACHSAAGNRDQPDEVLHLAAAMQFAGFRRVVGSLWAVCDLDGPEVARSFYSSLLGTGGRQAAKSSAHALHRAVQELRARPGVSISRWACFVHFGC